MRFTNYTEKISKKEANLSLKQKQDIHYVRRRISKMVKMARIDKGLTQLQLSHAVGTKQPSIARLESGEISPSISFLNSIAKALDTHLIEPRFDSIAHYYVEELKAIREEAESAQITSQDISLETKKDFVKSNINILNYL